MKITKTQLKQIIKEELKIVLKEDRFERLRQRANQGAAEIRKARGGLKKPSGGFDDIFKGSGQLDDMFKKSGGGFDDMFGEKESKIKVSPGAMKLFNLQKMFIDMQWEPKGKEAQTLADALNQAVIDYPSIESLPTKPIKGDNIQIQKNRAYWSGEVGDPKAPNWLKRAFKVWAKNGSQAYVHPQPPPELTTDWQKETWNHSWIWAGQRLGTIAV